MDSSAHNRFRNIKPTLLYSMVIILTLFLGNCSVPSVQKILIIGLTGADTPLSLRRYLQPESGVGDRNRGNLVLSKGAYRFQLLEYADNKTILGHLKSSKQRPLAIILAVDAMNGIHESHIQALRQAQNLKIPLLAVLRLRFGELYISPYKHLAALEIKQVLADTGFSKTPVHELQSGQSAANRSLLLSLLQQTVENSQ